MKIIATSDIDDAALDAIAEELHRELDVRTDRGNVALLSGDPPSWVHVVAEAVWWQQVLGAGAALYAAELVKEAVKGTWREKAKLFKVVSAAADKLSSFARTVGRLRNGLNPRTAIAVAVPFPNEYFSTRMKLTTFEPEELASEVALFVHHLDKVNELISEEGLALEKPATGLFLELLPRGDLRVKWFDGRTLEERVRIFKL